MTDVMLHERVESVANRAHDLTQCTQGNKDRSSGVSHCFKLMFIG